MKVRTIARSGTTVCAMGGSPLRVCCIHNYRVAGSRQFETTKRIAALLLRIAKALPHGGRDAGPPIREGVPPGVALVQRLLLRCRPRAGLGWTEASGPPRDAPCQTWNAPPGRRLNGSSKA